ncbi:MAG: enoyl-CoA hydratase/isomerase family protein [Acidimicrobiales bacterium]
MAPAGVRLDHRRGGSVLDVCLPGGPLGATTASALIRALEAAVEDRTLRAVVLRAEDGDFCTGPGPDLDPLAAIVDPASLLARIRVPVIAAVTGQCRSVGLELVLATDIVLAGPDATFALPEVAQGRGLPCWGGTQRLARAVGVARSGAMVLLGEELDAVAAQGAGLVWSVISEPAETPAGQDADSPVTAAALALAERLCGLGPLALEFAKEAVHRGAELPLRDGLRLEGDLNTLLATSSDRAEGLAAFFAKRPADFAGR